MNVLPSSLPAAAQADAPSRTARNDAPAGEGAGSFAEVLGRRLQPAGDGAQPETAPAGRAGKAGMRRLQEPDEREGVAADALPLIAAALESRGLANPQAGAAPQAAGAQAPDALPGVAVPGTAGESPEGAPDVPSPGDAAADAKAPFLASLPDAGTARSSRAQGSLATRESSAPAAAAKPLESADAPPRLAADAPADPVARPAPASAPQPAPDTTSRTIAPASAQEQDAPLAADSNPPGVTVAAAHAPASAAATPLAQPEAAVAKGHVAPAVGSPAWAPAFGQEVVRIHHAGQGQAQLELNPPGLGPLSVSLSVSDQQAQAVFMSPHAAVRAAVEAALPQLRNALADSGITLGQASVGAEHQPGSGASSHGAQDPGTQRRPAAAAFLAPERGTALSSAPLRSGGHAIDTFA